MNCEQKSGVFLNQACERAASKTCDTCKKEICKRHFHTYDTAKLCEDCFWEKFLYAEEKKEEFYDTDDYTNFDRGTSSSSTSSTNTDDTAFNDGFGGGAFGGGGASGEWTEGDAAGFNDTNPAGGLLDKDDTFYYS